MAEALSRAYANSRPYSIREEKEIHGGKLRRRFFIDHADPVSVDLALAVGDCVQNLRAALDHLAWQLVLKAGNAPTDKTAFPIFDSRYTKKGKARNIRIVGGVDPGALAIVKASQPYLRTNPANDPLAILRDLSNIDKHRALLLLALSYDAAAQGGGGFDPWSYTTTGPIPLEGAAQVGVVTYASPNDPGADVDVYVELSPGNVRERGALRWSGRRQSPANARSDAARQRRSQLPAILLIAQRSISLPTDAKGVSP